MSVSRDDKTLSWVVMNPGGIPEMVHLAEYLGRTGAECHYLSPFPLVSTPHVVEAMARFGRTGRALRNRFARRANAGLDAVATHRMATVSEAAFQVASTARRFELAARTLRLRNRAFDRGTARWVNASDVGPDTVVVGRSTTCLKTFRKARSQGAFCLLDYPIMHHDPAERILRAEASKFPEWASSLSEDLRSPRLKVHLDAEIELASAVLVLSQRHLESFLEAGVPREKLVLANLGVDCTTFAPPIIPRDPKISAKRLLFVGQITQRKGVAYLLEAFENLPSDYSLTLVGKLNGPPVRHPRVKVLEPMSRDQLADVYRDSGIFVFPSLVEGFPQTPLEAMATGLPVVGSRQSYGADGPFSRGGGIAVDARNPEEIAAGILRLADPATYQTMAAAAIATSSRYTWPAFCADVIRDVENRALRSARGG